MAAGARSDLSLAQLLLLRGARPRPAPVSVLWPDRFRAALALLLAYGALVVAPPLWLAGTVWAWGAGLAVLALGLAVQAVCSLLLVGVCLLRLRQTAGQ